MNEIISIGNDRVKLDFSRATNFGVRGIISVKSGVNFLSGKTPRLWRICLKNRLHEFVTIDNDVSSNKSYGIEQGSHGNPIGLHFSWRHIPIGEEPNALDVRVSVNVDDELTCWRISVENKSSDWGVWNVQFPILNGLIVEPGNAIAYPWKVGRLCKDPLSNMPLKMVYPSYTSTMQYSLFLRKNECLYLAAHDPLASYKCFTYEKDGESELVYYLINYPEGMGLPGTGYIMPYDAVVTILNGDWITGSKFYRQWALKQYWCRKGPIWKRRDLSKWLMDITVWFSRLVSPLGDYREREQIPVNIQKIVDLAKYLNVPVGYHWYWWENKPYDTGCPEYFPPKLEFKPGVEELHKAGIYVMPYINARLWDVDTESWHQERAEMWCTKAPFKLIDGLRDYYLSTGWWRERTDITKYVEHWGARFAVMCPYTEFWQEKITTICDKLIGEYDVDGVYLDQISSWYPVLCFDPTHGHPIGGGHYWVDGYRRLIEKVYRQISKRKYHAFLTSEDNAEPYIDLVGLLTWSPLMPDMIPMFQMVYSGWCITFGRSFPSNDELAIILTIAQQLLWGTQLGWLDPDAIGLQSPEAEYLKEATSAFKTAKKFVLFGEMLRPPVLEGDNPTVKIGEVETPAVLCSCWKAPDNTIGLVFTNIDTAPHKITYQIDTRNYSSLDQKSIILSRLYKPPKQRLAVYDSPQIVRTIEMEGRSIQVLEIFIAFQ
jgi:hypothetical protein